MKENERMPEMAGIFNLGSATVIDMPKYINKAVKVINMVTLKSVFAAKLTKPKAKVRNMYNYGNCLA